MSNLVKVAEAYLVQEGEEFVGIELVFTEDVRNKRGACMVLDTLRGRMDNSGWVTQTIMRVEDKEPQDAQTNEQAVEGGNSDAESVADEAKSDAE